MSESILESSLSGKTEAELKQMAENTGKKIDALGVDNFVNINEEAILKAVTLISNPDYGEVEVRNLILDLVQVVADLKAATDELLNYNRRSSLESVHSAGGTKSISSVSRIEQIREIQDIITKDYATAIGSGDVEIMKGIIRNIITTRNIVLKGTKSIQESIDEAIKELTSFSILDPYMNQPDDTPFEDFVEEIRIDDFNDIRIVKGGLEYKIPEQFDSPEHLKSFAEQLMTKASERQPFTKNNPFARLRVGRTTRVSMMRDPIAVRDKRVSDDDSVIHIVIRKQRTAPFTEEKLIELGSLDEYTAMLIRTLMRSGISTAWIGGTGTGKTSMMNGFLNNFTDRTISMAEVDEMNLRNIDYRQMIQDSEGRNIPNPEYLKASNSAIMWEAANPDAKIVGNLKWFQGMFNAALTMTPSAIIIQETKGPEMKDLVEAAVSDHQVCTSVHATNASVFHLRSMKMLQSAGESVSEDVMMKEIIEAFPVIVSCARLKDGTRKIAEVVELLKYVPETKEIITNTMVRYEVEKNIINPSTGKLKAIGSHKVYNRPSSKLYQLMLRKGLLEETRTQLDIKFEKVKSPDKPADLDASIFNEKRGA